MVSVSDLKSVLAEMITFVEMCDLGREALNQYKVFNAKFSELHRQYRIERKLSPNQSDGFDLVRNAVSNAFQFKNKAFLEEARARLEAIS